MKKLVLASFAALILSFSVNAEVLPSEQMKNTAWTGLGAPIDGDPMYYGFTDTFQARFDRGKFTVEGMLNWSFLANYGNDGDVDNFFFGTSNLNPLAMKYGTRNATTRAGTDKVYDKLTAKLTDADRTKLAAAGITDYKSISWLSYLNDQADVSNTFQDSYYVNFFYHFTKNLELGVGTKLNWQVGPAPRYGSWLWEADAHVRQGGFSTAYDDRSGVYGQTSSETVSSYKFTVDAPGSADVVGFVPYANKYAKRALGVRFVADGEVLELGAALPNGFNTDDPAVNVGAKFAPFEWLLLAATLEGALDNKANFYTGATLGMKNFILDLYFAADSLFTDADNDQAYGTGAAIKFTIPNTRIVIRPEVGVNFFQNAHYDFAWYTGGTFELPLSKQLGLNIWGSFAQGSKDDRWSDYDATKDWDGGHIINVRPELTFEYSKHTNFAVYFDFEQRTAFDGVSRKCWSTGLFWTYTF
ncbi:hypothetical protein [Treponema sp.]|uniref:hypothetical protein n=1 Tax=Treponema sp. TaxID=166 RepID=UPI003890C86D